MNGTIKAGTGTSFAAPMVSAAAAIVYSHFTAKGFSITPWLLEDILLNAMPSRESLQSTVRNGKVLDFEALKNYLTVLSEMGEEERAQIPSENQDVGTGWDPNRDIERIAEVIVDAPDATSVITKGQQVQLRALARYTDGSTQDVTNHPNIFWTVQYEPEGFTSVSPKGGLVSVLPSAKFELGTSIRVIAHYKTDYQGEFKFVFHDDKSPPSFNSLRMELSTDGKAVGRGARVTWGRTAQYRVLGKYTTQSGKDIEADLTQVANVEASKPDELIIDQNVKGLLRTTKTYGGSTYTLTATYRNLTAQSSIAIDKLQATLEIRNALQDPYKGQPLTLRAALVAPTLPEDLVLKADWKSVSNGLSISQSNVSEITIMTEDLPVETYQIEASAEFRGMGENVRLTARHRFTVLNSVMRMELLTKTPILFFQNRGVFVLRLYNRNNSFSVVDPRKIRWSTSSADLPIDAQGIISPTSKSIKDAKTTNYTVFAEYLGQRVSAPVAISPANTVSGSQAQLSHIVVNAEWGRNQECSTASPKAGCERIVASGTSPLISGLQAIAYYSDGRTRDVTRYATWSTSHPYMTMFLMNSSKYQVIIGPQSRPGDVIKITALYEGQQAGQLVTMLPVKDVLLVAPTQGRAFEFDTAENWNLPKPELRIAGERDEKGFEFGEVKKPLLWSSTDPKVIAAIRKLNTPVRANEDVSIDTKLLPAGNSYPISLTYTFEGYGLQKVIQADFLLKNVAVQPSGLKIALNGSLWNWNFRERTQLLDCLLEYPNRSPVKIPCSDVELKFSMSDGSSSPTDITQDVYLSEYYFTPGGEERTVTLGRTVFPTQFLINVPENSDRLFTVEGTHKKLGFKAPPQTGHVVGTDRLDSKAPLGAFPTEAPVKADDPFCTEARRKNYPVAGGKGTKDDPLVVCTPRQLMDVSKATTQAGFDYTVELKANLDFAGVSGLAPISLSAPNSGNARTFRGNGYRISNVTLIDRERDNLAIFAVRGLLVQDLIIDKALVRGDASVGILASDELQSASNVQILRSSVQGTRKVGVLSGDGGKQVSGVLVKDSHVFYEEGEAGCIFGASYRSSIVNSVCSSTNISPVGVQGTQRAIGGLVGLFQESNTITNLQRGADGQQVPLVPSSAWISQPRVHIFNSHFSGTINAGLSVNGGAVGQSGVGGLVGEAEHIGIVNSSAKADITSLGSNVGGLVGSFICSSRNAGVGFVLGSSFEGSITGGQALTGLSNAGGLVGSLFGRYDTFKASCMIIGNKVSGVVRGRSGVGGLVGRAPSGNRFIGNEVSVNVTSSTERHGGFIGSLEANGLRVYRVKDRSEYRMQDVYQGNIWRYTGTGKAPMDVGTSNVRSDALSGLDVVGVDQR